MMSVLDNEGRKEGNVLFNEALNTFYLWLYGIRHMVKDHSHSETGNSLPPHGLLFPVSRQDNIYHGLCYISHVTLAGTRNSSMGPSRRIDPTIHRTMSGRSYHRGRMHSTHLVSVIWCRTYGKGPFR